MKKLLFIFSFMVITLLLAACGMIGGTAVVVDAPDGASTIITDASGETEVDAGTDAKCPEPVSGTHQLVNAALGYCFLYPDNYDVFEGDDGSISLYVKSLLNTEAPFASIHQQPAAGKNLDEVTEQGLKDFGFPDTVAEPTTLGGQPASLMDNLPGQDTNRRILALHGDMVYELQVARIGQDYGVVGEQAEALFDQIRTTFQFIEPVPGAGLVAGPECPQPKSDTTIYTNEDDGYCLLLPAGYMIDAGLTSDTGGSETAVYMNSLQDVEHARLFIVVEDAQGRTLQEVTDAIEAEIKTALPEMDVMWSFGYMLDGVAANQFDQLPGQDLNRRVVMVHNDQVFTLIFIPDDPSAADAYREMEAMYELAMDSFSFLRGL